MCDHDCCRRDASDASHAARTRRGGLLRTVFQLALLYVLLVFGSGTLIRTGHPVAVELGRLIQTVTFVEPAIGWAEAHHCGPLAGGLRTLANGVDIVRWT